MRTTKIIHYRPQTYSRLLAIFVSGWVLVLGAVSLYAKTITFSALEGPDSAPFTSYMEKGFTVTPSLGDWIQDISFGKPAPSILVGPDVEGTILVTNGGKLFTFNSLDVSSQFGDSSIDIQALRGTDREYILQSNVPDSHGAFTTISNTENSSTPLSTLLVDIMPDSKSSFNIDNINVSPVPEPSTLAFVALAAGFGILKCRRRVAHRDMRSEAV